ncbi:hypothetical protein ACFLYD_05900 [Chloroflexota bacterium]
MDDYIITEKHNEVPENSYRFTQADAVGIDDPEVRRRRCDYPRYHCHQGEAGSL